MFLGQDGFVWWLGVIEDIADPMLLGRARVRIFGYHPQYKVDENINPDTSINKVPISELPWAVPVLPVNMVNAYGHLKLGEWVFGFFLDGKDAQEPAMLGYIPHIPPKDMPKPEELFGKYGDNIRNFAHVYTNALGEPFRSQDFGQPGKEYSHRLDRFSFKTPSGHLIEFIDDVTDIHTRDMQISHANGSKLIATSDHLGNHDITLSESGGQNIKMSTTLTGDCTINISHPKGASIVISPDGQVTINSPENVSVVSAKAVNVNALTVNLNSATTNNQNVLNTKSLNAMSINLTGVGDVAAKIALMDAEIEIAKTLPPPAS